jgi:hypothetical protein
MKFPDQPKGLHDVPTFCRDMRNYVRSITIRPSAFIRVSQTPNGTTLAPASRGRYLGEARAADPFEPIPAAGAATVSFEPGIITNAGANISPTVGGGSTMATVPRPSLTITTAGTIYLEATVDAAGTATAIDTKNAASTPADTSTLKHLTLADVTLSGSTVTVTGRPVRESRSLFICSGTAIWD